MHKRLAAHISGVFAEAEGVEFEKRLGKLLPVIEREIHPSNFEDVSHLARKERRKAEVKLRKWGGGIYYLD